jgi:VWFA-related protein
MRGPGLAGLAVLAAPAVLFAADPRPLALAVHDAQGQFVADLRAEEVRVLENGEPRELAGFERDERPLVTALVLDTSIGASRVFRTQAFDAVWSFVSGLPQGSKCLLWGTGDRPRKLGALEGERKDVDKKVGQGFASQGANVLMDTVVEAANALERESGKRRALVVLTGAGAGHASYTPNDVTGAARKAGAPIFGVMYDEGEAASAGSLRMIDGPRDADNLTIVGPADHEKVLSGLAQGTGGRFQRVASAAAAPAAFQPLAAELGGQYRLRYVPADGKGPRRVEVRVARPGLHWRIALDSP